MVTGFQQEVRNKVAGFGSHLFILNSSGGNIYECDPIRKNQTFYEELKKAKDILSIQAVAYKPVILQSDKFVVTHAVGGKDTSYQRQEIHGALMKGVDNQYDWKFIKENLKEGRLPNYGASTASNEVLISSKVASILQLKLGDNLKGFFVKAQPVKRAFKIVGIYHTGLEEFDKKFVICDIRNVQQLNDWGIQAEITVDDSLYLGQLIVRADVSGGNGNYRYNWGEGYEMASGFTICPTKDTTIQLIVSDYYSSLKEEATVTSIPDTALLSIKIKGNGNSYCDFKLNQLGELERTYLNEDGSNFSFTASQKTVELFSTPGIGSYKSYVGGFEVNVKDWSKLSTVHERLKKKIEFIPNQFGELFLVRSLIDYESDIFVWLGFLDVNVYIILSLMILIGIINMGSALLVLILVRSNFIGLMKAMGATASMIRRIFLIQAAYLIFYGIVIGNVIGLALLGIQYFFKVLQLNPDIYYLNYVPVELNFWTWLGLNVGTLVICVLALIIPSYAIGKIHPAKAIKFN